MITYSAVTIKNTEVPSALWRLLGTRDVLRKLAKEKGIRRGRDTLETCINLSRGTGSQYGTIVEFEVSFKIL